MRDVLVTVLLLIFIAAGFYAFQLIVLGIVGLAIYWTMPFIKQFLSRRRKLWK